MPILFRMNRLHAPNSIPWNMCRRGTPIAAVRLEKRWDLAREIPELASEMVEPHGVLVCTRYGFIYIPTGTFSGK